MPDGVPLPLMPRLFMAIHQEDCFPIVDILRQIPAIPDNCQWALFLRNHDELTLEMVTELADHARSIMFNPRVLRAPGLALGLGLQLHFLEQLGLHIEQLLSKVGEEFLSMMRSPSSSSLKILIG